jgi:hypothetical protein
MCAEATARRPIARRNTQTTESLPRAPAPAALAAGAAWQPEDADDENTPAFFDAPEVADCVQHYAPHHIQHPLPHHVEALVKAAEPRDTAAMKDAKRSRCARAAGHLQLPLLLLSRGSPGARMPLLARDRHHGGRRDAVGQRAR